MQKVQRKSGIELLRIICMLMIIVLHVYTYAEGLISFLTPKVEDLK